MSAWTDSIAAYDSPMGSLNDSRSIRYTYDYADEKKVFTADPTNGVAYNEEHRRRMREWYGFTPDPGKECPRRVAGKRCTAESSSTCICLEYYNVLDHKAMWKDTLRGNVLVMTAEPFGINGEDIAALHADLADIGLTVAVRSESPYYPGRTVLLLIKKPDSPA